MAAGGRDSRGRFFKPSRKRKKDACNSVCIDHNYAGVFGAQDCVLISDSVPKSASKDSWRTGRRVIELGTLLENLKSCSKCKLGPVPLTYFNVSGELFKGLSGYLYVKCQNVNCGHINRVKYGSTHRLNKKGMPCFSLNTKLGVAMIDGVGGSVKVNNMLSTMNLKPISRVNLQQMERRAGCFVEAVAARSEKEAAQEAFRLEMSDIAKAESERAETTTNLIKDLGVGPLDVSSPSLVDIAKAESEHAETMTNLDKDLEVAPLDDSSPFLIDIAQKESEFAETATNLDKDLGVGPFDVSSPSVARKLAFAESTDDDGPVVQCRGKLRVPIQTINMKARRGLLKKYQDMTLKRNGMSCAIDTAWQKRGFDSLTSHTFLMSKSCYGKKVVKSIVCHRQCSTCNWWRRNRPGRPVREHKCVKNHSGSSRLMESVSGEKAILDLAKEGTPVEYLEGDGDTTLMARMKANHNLTLKKTFDKNHVIKNIGKSLYALKSEKGVKISKNTVTHLQKSISYALSKNRGDEQGLQNNLRAIISVYISIVRPTFVAI